MGTDDKIMMQNEYEVEQGVLHGPGGADIAQLCACITIPIPHTNSRLKRGMGHQMSVAERACCPCVLAACSAARARRL